MQVLKETDFEFKGQKSVYHGKVRDVYNIEDKYMVMVATDRISAFDVVLQFPTKVRCSIRLRSFSSTPRRI